MFSYDNAGNITSVSEYRLSSKGWYPSYLIKEKTYTYGDSNWKDKLTSYNGTKITYDGMGNPLSYRDGMSFTWENGRRLKSISTGNNTVNMKYDSNGMRTQKDDDNYTTNYYYDSKNNLIGFDKSGSTLFFYYDSEGTPTSFSNNGIMYYYVKNLQGDIVKIVKQDGTVAATYTYDAWGKILSIKDTANNEVPSSNTFHVANLNPYRYRGYIYDNESGLYYLQSRYYDPITGRFLNADDTQYIITNVLSSNLYTYCLNNSISYVDYNGRVASATILTFMFWGVVTDAIINTMTFQFYAHAFVNREENQRYDFSDNKMYVNKIKQTKQYQDFVNTHLSNLDNILERMIHQHEYYLSIYKELDFTRDGEDIDLHLSIGHCTIAFIIKKISSFSSILGNIIRNYSISIVVSDLYDFKYIEKASGVVDYINNILGYDIQTSGGLIPYYWYIDYSFLYIYICNHGY